MSFRVVVCGRWAHPRVSGENRLVATWRRERGGSSPRERGKLLHGGLLIGVQRLIPA